MMKKGSVITIVYVVFVIAAVGAYAGAMDWHNTGGAMHFNQMLTGILCLAVFLPLSALAAYGQGAYELPVHLMAIVSCVGTSVLLCESDWPAH